VNGRTSTKQEELLLYIVTSTEVNGFQPSRSEMAARFGVTPNAIACRLRGLEARGLISTKNRRDRAITLCGLRFVAVTDKGVNCVG
jgi:predicted transcriptional regulator